MIGLQKKCVERHIPPLYYDSKSKHTVDTEEQLAEYIINAPYVFFEGDEEKTNEDY